MTTTMAASMEQCTETSQGILTDVVEWLTEEIIFTDNSDDLLEKWETLEYFWKLLPKSPTFGRLFVRYRLAKLMTAVAHSDPYSQEQAVVKDKKKKKKSLVHPPLSLVQWSSQHWKDCMALLTSTRDLMLRKDADLLVDYEAEENDDEHEERANSDLYSVKLERLLVYMRIHRAMAAFRASMEQQLAHQDSAEAVKVEPSILAKFGEIVQTDFAEDEKSRLALEGILVRSGKGSSTRSHGVSLVSATELRQIMGRKPFTLNLLQRKLSLLLQRWARDVFSHKPTLSQLGYSPDALVMAMKQQQALQEQASSDEEEEQDAKLPAQKDSPMPVVQEEEEEDDDNDENTTPSPEKKRAAARRPKRKRDDSVSPAVVDPNVAKLKSARRDLQQDGTDPMQEIQRIAATAATGGGNRLLEKKKSATRVQFDDSDDDSEDDDEGERAHLSEVPARAKLATRKSKQVKSPKKKSGKRVPYSQEEKTAIRRGVEKYGKGKWAEIKVEYAEILRNRTSVNIKDCYRTMENKGEV